MKNVLNGLSKTKRKLTKLNELTFLVYDMAHRYYHAMRK